MRFQFLAFKCNFITLFICCGRSACGKAARNYSKCVCRFLFLILGLVFFLFRSVYVCLIFFSNLFSYVNFVVFAVLCSRPEHVSNFVDAESIFGQVFCSYILYLP